MSDTTPARVEGALTARSLLVQRLVDRHGLDPVEAHAAAARFYLGITDGPHAQLVSAEARAMINETYAAVSERSAEVLRSIAEAFRALGEAVRRAMTPVRADYVLTPADHVEILLDGEWTDISDSISEVTVQPAAPQQPNRAARRHRAATPDRPAWQSPYGPTPRH